MGTACKDLYVLNMQGQTPTTRMWQGKLSYKRAAKCSQNAVGFEGIKAFDYDNDGRLVSFLSDMHSDMSQPVGPWDEKLRRTCRIQKIFY